MALPTELHLLIIDHPYFWDTYALRLTCRHFASITPAHRISDERSPKAGFNRLTHEMRMQEAGVIRGLCEEFNKSWLANKSNVAHWYLCGPHRCEDCGCCVGWERSDFPFMNLPIELQRNIISRVQFYAAASLRQTSRHLRAITPPIGPYRDEFEKLYNQTLAAGGNIPGMCGHFNFSWYAVGVQDVTYDGLYILEKGCDCGRKATDVYAEGCGEFDMGDGCGWGVGNYEGYPPEVLKQ